MTGSLAFSKNFVADAFKVGATTFYKPEDIVLGEYTFLPWVRTGLAAAIQSPAGTDLRGVVEVTADLVASDGSQPAQSVKKTLILRGPGDVVGIDPSQIIRREPSANTVNAEETFLAHIEFDRPELPWLFSPFAPTGDALLPWLALVVCKADRVILLPSTPGRPIQLATMLGELQPLTDAASWAHAQAIGRAAAKTPLADRLSDDHAPANLSRILCPRKLEPQTDYIACLVPAFDCGVRAGLGQPGGTLEPAWTRAADNSDAATQIILPIYDSWTFSTAPAGDFKTLAEKLEGIAAPWTIGRRIIDTSRPEGGLQPLPPREEGTVQILKCALVSPQSPPAGGPSETSTWNPARRDDLRVKIDQANEPGHEDLPRVGPRLYARFQRGASQLGKIFGDPPSETASADADWFSQLNTNPLNRIVAGLGTRVVVKDQEQLMQAAWAQVGEVRKVNASLIRHQLGRYVGESLYRLHLSNLELGPLTQVMRGVQAKLKLDGDALTVYGKVEASRTAPVAMTTAYRRATRLRGPVARFTKDAGPAALKGLVAGMAGFNDFRVTYVNPDGVGKLSLKAINALSVDIVARRLGVDPSVAIRTLTERLSVLERNPTIADLALSPAGTWRVPAGNIDLSAILAETVATKVATVTPAAPERDSGRAEALSGLLVGLANSGIASVATKAASQVQVFSQKIPFKAINITPGPVLTPSPITRPLLPGTGMVTPLPHSGVRVQTPLRPPVVTRPVGSISDTVTAEAATRVPATPAPLVRFETATSRALTGDLTKFRDTPAMDIAAAISTLAVDNGMTVLPLTPDRPALAVARTSLLQAVTPATTMTRYVTNRLVRMPSWLPSDWFANGRIDPIMAAPHFDRPMYEALDAYDRDWLIPGIGTINKTDFVTLLNTNAAFTESFLIGLSDEMGRELLWRGYPTDQRGTYFRRFWDESKDELSSYIHKFSKQPLGAHISIGGNNIVLVVRGEIVKRYPHAIAAAVLAQDDNDQRPTFVDHTAQILFHHHLDPDFLLVGFKLTEAQVRAEPWWFIIAEHPTAPRFGFAAGAPQGAAAAIAAARLRDPVRAAFRGKLLLNQIQSAGGPNA